MPDREKAIRILEGNYKSFVLRHNGELLTVNELIALLKAQEPVEPKKVGPLGCWQWHCGVCGMAVEESDNYCHECGRAVKWE